MTSSLTPCSRNLSRTTSTWPSSFIGASAFVRMNKRRSYLPTSSVRSVSPNTTASNRSPAVPVGFRALMLFRKSRSVAAMSLETVMLSYPPSSSASLLSVPAENTHTRWWQVRDNQDEPTAQPRTATNLLFLPKSNPFHPWA
jgi:hypothetical protein